jgi:putative flippase GtrA
VSGLYQRFQHLVHEVAKFASVGAVAYIIDFGLFNILRFAGGQGPLYDRPLTAKVVSVVAATTFAYFANRHWTWKDRERTGLAREYTLFFLINGVALVLSVGVLWISHYVLGFTSPLADNISANVIGLALGTMFRFFAYRRWVFPESSAGEPTPPVVTAASPDNPS